MAHEVNSPKKPSSIFPDDDGTGIIIYQVATDFF